MRTQKTWSKVCSHSTGSLPYSLHRSLRSPWQISWKFSSRFLSLDARAARWLLTNAMRVVWSRVIPIDAAPLFVHGPLSGKHMF